MIQQYKIVNTWKFLGIALGIALDKNMNFHTEIQNICRKAGQTLSALSKKCFFWSNSIVNFCHIKSRSTKFWSHDQINNKI